MKPTFVYLEAKPRIYQKKDYGELFQTALNFHAQGRLNEAVMTYMEALQIHDTDALLYANMSGVMSALERFNEGVNLALKALKLNPMLSIAYNNLGTCWHGINRHDKAEMAYRKAFAVDPKNAIALQGLGNSLTMLGKFEEAIEVLHRAFKLDQRFQIATNIGMAYWGIGDIDAAIEWLRKAIEMNPDCDQARKNLGMNLFLKEEYAEGWKQYEHRLHPSLR